WRKALAFGCLLLIIHVTLFSFSRGGMIGLIALGAVAVRLMPKTPLNWLAVMAALVFTLAAAGPEVRARFATTFAERTSRDASADSRLELWSNCWQMMRENPILGIGPCGFHLISHVFGWPEGKQGHTTWLQLGAELGLPGLILIAVFYALPVI